VRQELVAQASPEAAPFTRPAMSTKRTKAGTVFFGLKRVVKSRESVVGHRDHAHVGLDGRERIVGSGGVARGQRVENGGLADVGKATMPISIPHLTK